MAEIDTQLTKQSFKEKTIPKIYSSDEEIDVGFECTDYSPAVFRNIMKLQNIDVGEYLEAIFGFENLKRVISYGKCGGVFLSFSDDRFAIKILRKSELKVLREILPNYYDHLTTYEVSFLTKLFGLHVVKPNGGPEVYFAVWSNFTKSNHQISECYDLKGTTIGRSNLKNLVSDQLILKDEDFDFSFLLDPLLCHRILQQIKYDCEFLEAHGIMDYSFILSIHSDGQQHQDLLRQRSKRSRSSTSGRSSPVTPSASASESSSFDRSHMSSGDALGQDTFERELSLSYLCSPSPERCDEKFGVDMAARATRIPKNIDGCMMPPSESFKREEYRNVILNFGIVDIGERYGMVKRVEHVYKSLHYRSKSVGSVDPKTYSCRLQDFISRVFQSDHQSSTSMVDPCHCSQPEQDL